MATTTELGRMVKTKYPGAYDEIADQDVGRMVKVKFPGSYDQFTDEPTPPHEPLMLDQEKFTAPSREVEGSVSRTIRTMGETAADAVRLYGSLGGALEGPLSVIGAAGSYLVPYTGSGTFEERRQNEARNLAMARQEALKRSPVAAGTGALLPGAVVPFPTPYSSAAKALPAASRTIAGVLDTALVNMGMTAGQETAEPGKVPEKMAAAGRSPWNLLGVAPTWLSDFLPRARGWLLGAAREKALKGATRSSEDVATLREQLGSREAAGGAALEMEVPGAGRPALPAVARPATREANVNSIINYYGPQKQAVLDQLPPDAIDMQSLLTKLEARARETDTMIGRMTGDKTAAKARAWVDRLRQELAPEPRVFATEASRTGMAGPEGLYHGEAPPGPGTAPARLEPGTTRPAPGGLHGVAMEAPRPVSANQIDELMHGLYDEAYLTSNAKHPNLPEASAQLDPEVKAMRKFAHDMKESIESAVQKHLGEDALAGFKQIKEKYGTARAFLPLLRSQADLAASGASQSMPSAYGWRHALYPVLGAAAGGTHGWEGAGIGFATGVGADLAAHGMREYGPPIVARMAEQASKVPNINVPPGATGYFANLLDRIERQKEESK